MKAILLALVMALGLAGVARADATDETRGLLYRIDAQAHSLLMHPTDSTDPAQALARTANDAAARLRADGLPAEAEALRKEAASLAAAARNHEDEDTRAHAIRIERLVRAVDESLPPRPVLP